MIEIDKKFGKYVNPEVELKFLVKEIPDHSKLYSEITDYYISDTTLRLRKDERSDGVRYKLSQKIRPNPNSTRLILHTNIYLTKSEFNLLITNLPSNSLSKKRYQLDVNGIPIWIDQFKDKLEGLIIAEVDLGVNGDTQSFVMPSFAEREITDDERFTGVNLASISIEKLQNMKI